MVMKTYHSSDGLFVCLFSLIFILFQLIIFHIHDFFNLFI